MTDILLRDHDKLPASCIVAPSADYKSVDPATQVIACRGATALVVEVDCTAATGTGGVTVTIKGFDEASGTYNTILASALIATSGHTKYTVSPLIADATNVSKQAYLPPKVQITMVGSGTRTTLNYSVGAFLSTS